MKLGDLLHVLTALPLVQGPRNPMNMKMGGSTAGLEALGMLLMVKKEPILTVNMITDVMTY